MYVCIGNENKNIQARQETLRLYMRQEQSFVNTFFITHDTHILFRMQIHNIQTTVYYLLSNNFIHTYTYTCKYTLGYVNKCVHQAFYAIAIDITIKE